MVTRQQKIKDRVEIHIRIPPTLNSDIKALAEFNGVTISAQVTKLLIEYADLIGELGMTEWSNIKGVYGIFNRQSDRVYIGATKSIHSRSLTHRSYLRGSLYRNDMQKDFNGYEKAKKDGLALFDFIPLQVTLRGQLSLSELEYLWMYRFKDSLYNTNVPEFSESLIAELEQKNEQDLQTGHCYLPTKTTSLWGERHPLRPVPEYRHSYSALRTVDWQKSTSTVRIELAQLERLRELARAEDITAQELLNRLLSKIL